MEKKERKKEKANEKERRGESKVLCRIIERRIRVIKKEREYLPVSCTKLNFSPRFNVITSNSHSPL